ncbi:hypothetical protein A5849_000126 [Enterococcus sp. 10F3_DIV0382]|nr:hypothetical protein A5849_000126 [Enterococcus sp. 10F3_DIV0382]
MLTAEIGILNKNGVVIAADSAVTMSGSNNQKIYNSANKVFALAPSHDIGMMIYGNASISGIPWEVLIKEYRKNLSKPFGRTLEYISDFLDFLETIKDIQSNQSETDLVVRYVNELLNLIHEELTIAIFQKDEIDKDEEFVRLLDEMKREFAKAKPFTKKETLKEFNMRFDENVRSIYDDFCEKLGISNKVRDNKRSSFISILRNALFSKEYFSNSKTGLVITGYGENDLFPSLYSLSIEGYIGGKLKILMDNRLEISVYGTTSGIAPFAQQEMVHTVMRGIDPEMQENIELITSIGFDNFISSLEDEKLINDYYDEDIQILKDSCQDAIKSTIKDKINSSYVNPVLRSIDLMPKEELATIAETLVNITSFKRKISMEMETVGGPIDVLLITKSDGPIWIKRKYYFEEKINPDYHKRKFFS